MRKFSSQTQNEYLKICHLVNIRTLFLTFRTDKLCFQLSCVLEMFSFNFHLTFRCKHWASRVPFWTKNETKDYLPRPLRRFNPVCAPGSKSAIFRGFWRFWRRRLRKYQPEKDRTARNDRLRRTKNTPKIHTCADKNQK